MFALSLEAIYTIYRRFFMAWIYMYDVRGIQDYVFRTNKMKEIIGASLLVEDLIKKIFT